MASRVPDQRYHFHWKTPSGWKNGHAVMWRASRNTWRWRAGFKSGKATTFGAAWTDVILLAKSQSNSPVRMS